jgi:hypothetical protein
MRQVVLRCAVAMILACGASGCCVLDFWSSSANRTYSVDLGKIGSGEQAVYSPNEGQPWQGDAAEKAFGH